jgi:hypothetical protein
MVKLRFIPPEEIEARRTERGGWNRETLAAWGIPWPPPQGWREKLDKMYRFRSDFEHYYSLPPHEQVKAWDSYKRLEDAGQMERITHLLARPEN